MITLEGWVEIMYYVMDAHSFYNFIYFILLIIVSIRASSGPWTLRWVGVGRGEGWAVPQGALRARGAWQDRRRRQSILRKGYF